jgi:hypothetical protein
MRALVLLVLLAARTASADGWHAGLDLRVDQGAHPIRAGGGIEVGRHDFMLVLDPMYWTDGQHDLDALGYLRLTTSGWSLLYGWRTTAIAIGDGHQLQEKFLLGFGAPLPFFGKLPVRAKWSFELASLVVKHRGGLPRQWISFDSGRDFIDLLNFGMFVTFEYEKY